MKLICGLIFLLSLSGSASAQGGVSRKEARTAAELIQIEKDIGQANIRRDKAFFERIEADEFIFTDSSGGITTRAEDIASLDKPAGDLKLVSYEVEDVRVKLYGETAVVTGKTTTISKSAEREVTTRSRFTDVFVRRSGRWMIVAGHSSRIRDDKK